VREDRKIPADPGARVDWEAELAVVIGRSVRRADDDAAAAAVAGFTVLNDVSMRDWQNRTLQWLQGKSFENTTPVVHRIPPFKRMMALGFSGIGRARYSVLPQKVEQVSPFTASKPARPVAQLAA